MKIIFNDADWIQIQDAALAPDGALKIKTISATQETLKSVFSDTEKTKKMIVEENGKTIAEYAGYTIFYGIMVHTGGILEPVLYRTGETPEEKIKKLEEKTSLQEEQISVMTECILELSEEVYK